MSTSTQISYLAVPAESDFAIELSSACADGRLIKIPWHIKVSPEAEETIYFQPWPYRVFQLSSTDRRRIKHATVTGEVQAENLWGPYARLQRLVVERLAALTDEHWDQILRSESQLAALRSGHGGEIVAIPRERLLPLRDYLALVEEARDALTKRREYSHQRAFNAMADSGRGTGPDGWASGRVADLAYFVAAQDWVPTSNVARAFQFWGLPVIPHKLKAEEPNGEMFRAS